MKYDTFLDLDPDLLVEFLTNDDLNVISEQQMCLALKRWAMYDWNNRSANFYDFMDYIRLPFLPVSVWNFSFFYFILVSNYNNVFNSIKLNSRCFSFLPMKYFHCVPALKNAIPCWWICYRGTYYPKEDLICCRWMPDHDNIQPY